MLVVGPVRIRIPGEIGIVLSLGDVAVGFARLIHPVWEEGGEEGPHERDAGAYAANAGLENGPEERGRHRKRYVGVGEAEQGHKSKNADDAYTAKREKLLGLRLVGVMVLDTRGLGTLTIIPRQIRKIG